MGYVILGLLGLGLLLVLERIIKLTQEKKKIKQQLASDSVMPGNAWAINARF